MEKLFGKAFISSVISLFAVSTLLFCFPADVLGKQATLCNKEKAQYVVTKAFSADLRQLFKDKVPKINVLEVSEIKLGNVTLCEVVWEFVLQDQKNRNQNRQKLPKNITYYGYDFVLTGDLRVIKREGKEEKYINITRDRLLALNKEYYEELQKKIEQEVNREAVIKEVKELAKREFDTLKTKADVKIVSKGAKADIVIFADPYCPHCVRMKDVVMPKAKRGQVNLYVIFTPVLGPASEKVSIGAICMGKTAEERLTLFAEKKQDGTICDEGKRKVKENLDYFVKFNGRGVPYSILKKGEIIEIFEGAISSNILDSFLR
ncbi:MAG: thioredoxin fold domain-containing protein [Zestosphaera sp.]